jgi:hypothetical protein
LPFAKVKINLFQANGTAAHDFATTLKVLGIPPLGPVAFCT